MSAEQSFAEAEARAERIESIAAKYASRTEFGEVIFPGQNWMMFVADLATPAPGAPGQEAAAVQAVGAWIGIDERRPEMDEPVLVFNPNGPLHVSIDEWCIYREAPVIWSSAAIETGEGWANHEFEQITHWMPLPAIPPSGAGEKTS